MRIILCMGWDENNEEWMEGIEGHQGLIITSTKINFIKVQGHDE